MKTYKTVVIVDSRIFGKIQLYRSFLENGKFKTLLSDTLFVSDDSAEELSSAELSISDTANCLYLYGLIDKDEYISHRDMIRDKLKSFQNTTFYMLFCQNIVTDGNNYDILEESNPHIQESPYCIGILEETDIPKENVDTVLPENLRCVKLLTLAIAICSYNEGAGGRYMPKNYYSTASVKLNYENVFYAAGYELSRFAEDISNKEKQIAELESVIERIKKEKPHKCVGHFTDASELLRLPELRDFSEYKSIGAMRRDLEVVGNRCTGLYEEAVSTKVKTARLGLACAEDEIEPVTNANSNGMVTSITVNYNVPNNYMTITEADEGDVAAPEDLLERPDSQLGFDASCIRCAIPLANELEKAEKPKAKKTLPVAIGILLLFILAAIVYGVRYIRTGLVDVDTKDLVLTLGLPVAAILLTAIIALCIGLYQHSQKKQIFKELHAGLKSFISRIKECCEGINEYINKYLTVYFNHHIKHGLITKFMEEVVMIKKDVADLKKNSRPYDELAQTMSRLSGKKLKAPDKELNEDGTVKKTVSQSIISKINNTPPTVHRVDLGNEAAQALTSPWIIELDVETGSYES